MVRRLAAVGAAALCLVVAFQFIAPRDVSSEPGEEAIVRIIDLAQVETCPACGGTASEQPASGRVTFHTWGWMGNGFMFRAGSLGTVPDAWALYLVEGTIEDGTILGRWTFNTYPWGGKGDISFGVGLGPEFPVDAPVLTAFVAYEPDDGRSFDPAQDMWALALVGVSER